MEERYCPKCKQINLATKNAIRNGVQRYKCKTCKSTFSAGNEYYAEIRYMAVKYYSLGLRSYRTIAKIFKISKNSICSWINSISNNYGYVDKMKMREIAKTHKKQYELVKEIQAQCKIEKHLTYELSNYDENMMHNLDTCNENYQQEIVTIQNKINILESILKDKYDLQTKQKIARLYDRLSLTEDLSKRKKNNTIQDKKSIVVALHKVQCKIRKLKSQCDIPDEQHIRVEIILKTINAFLDSL